MLKKGNGLFLYRSGCQDRQAVRHKRIGGAAVLFTLE